jgi:DNA-binding response OmpR family regulator
MSRPRILLIDDDPSVGRAVTAALSAYAVEWARDPESALRSAIAEPPDLVLLDVSMPVMDGWEVCEILRRQSHTRDVPIVFLTGRAALRDRISAMQAGGSAFLTKPFGADDLRSRVAAFVKVAVAR